jgi:hypothetical protein
MINPKSMSFQLVRQRRACPPEAGLSARGGLVRQRQACPPEAGLSARGGLVRQRRACPPEAGLSGIFHRKGEEGFRTSRNDRLNQLEYDDYV